MIKVFKMNNKKVETLLKEYKTIKGALNFIENYKNYDYILYATKRNTIIAFQSYQTRQNLIDKLFDKLDINMV
jgi:hypothetical protein